MRVCLLEASAVSGQACASFLAFNLRPFGWHRRSCRAQTVGLPCFSLLNLDSLSAVAVLDVA